MVDMAFKFSIQNLLTNINVAKGAVSRVLEYKDDIPADSEVVLTELTEVPLTQKVAGRESVEDYLGSVDAFLGNLGNSIEILTDTLKNSNGYITKEVILTFFYSIGRSSNFWIEDLYEIRKDTYNIESVYKKYSPDKYISCYFLEDLVETIKRIDDILDRFDVMVTEYTIADELMKLNQ